MSPLAFGDEFGVDYHEGHVWKILRGLGWSPQRPVGRARERNNLIQMPAFMVKIALQVVGRVTVAWDRLPPTAAAW